MKIILTIVVAVALVAVVVACQSKKKSDDEPKKSLVLYYSQTGTTKAVAEEIARLTGADIESIEVEVPYDADYQQTIERCQKEMAEGFVPTTKPLKADLSNYETIFLGYPIWFGTYAPPIAGLVAANDFAGKKIVPFCTFGSGGLEPSIASLKTALPKAEIVGEGYGVRTARQASAPKEIDRFLKENGFIAGEVEPLPDYSAMQPVTPEETEIFNAACGSYQFPLGTPVEVGKRETPDAVDYKFSATGKGFDGSDVTFTIYVTAGKADGSQPEFTRVVR